MVAPDGGTTTLLGRQRYNRGRQWFDQMFGPSSRLPTVRGYLRQRGVAPLVRPSRNQVEVEYLPPYGDPEVSIPGEVATYAVAGFAAVELLEQLRE